MNQSRVLGPFLTVFFGWLILAGPCRGDFMYKNYLVKYDRGQDLLCEPYVVEKNDWILKVFKRKGEISYRDFSEFLKIFRRVNPHIKDVNLIRPGQYILIPLQKIAIESLPGQDSGTVTIPFVTLSKPTDIKGIRSSAYVIKKGDCVSLLVSSMFGPFGTPSYLSGIDHFQRLNPSVNDLNRVFVGQKIVLPVPEMETEMEERRSKTASRLSRLAGMDAVLPPASSPFAITEIADTADLPLVQAAYALNARLLSRGIYYFPTQEGPDTKLDLSRYPVMIFENGSLILFRKESDRSKTASEAIQKFWKNLHIVDLNAAFSVDHVLSSIINALKIEYENTMPPLNDGGIKIAVTGKWILKNPFRNEGENRHICITPIDSPEEKTSHAIVRYLERHDVVIREILRKETASASIELNPQSETEAEFTTIEADDRKQFVKQFMAVVGYPYSQNVGITFPYAGIQVKAISNVVSTGNGTPVFIDFGDLYGDAISAIKQTGFDVVQIFPDDDFSTIMTKLSDSVSIQRYMNPTFLAADRPDEYNTKLTLPGVLMETSRKEKILLVWTDFPKALSPFFRKKEIRIVRIAHSKV